MGEALASNIDVPGNCNIQESIFLTPVTIEEVTEIISGLRNGVAHGCDGITTVNLKLIINYCRICGNHCKQNY